jgi:threonine dehydrogenase-like Zn-dependent dehydrogenase
MADVARMKVPDGMAHEEVLFLTDIFPTGYQAAEQAGIKGGEIVTIRGTGPVGLFAIQSTKVLGAERIIAVETVPERIAMAQKAGATDFINFAEEDVYERLTLPDGRDITLYRATRGGHFKLHDGHIRAAKPDDGNTLRGQHDSKRDDTVSHLLLSAVGLVGKQIVRDADGTKDALSIFLLAPYAVVSEEDIISERSPVFTGQPAERTFGQNLFKLLLPAPAAQSRTQNSASETHFRVRRPGPVVPAE